MEIMYNKIRTLIRKYAFGPFCIECLLNVLFSGGFTMCKEGKERENDFMPVTENELSVAESLKEALEEVEKIREGEKPKKSWREMIDQIKIDRDNGNL